jgi:urea ABC transporter substrate-binding protein
MTSNRRRTNPIMGAMFFIGAALGGVAGAEAQTGEPIKICVVDDASGDFALAVIPKTQGAQLAVDEINEAGGVLGRPLELIHYDGQSEVRRHQEFAQRCILDDEAHVVMAGYTSSEREAARSVAVDNQTIFWHNNQGEGGIADKYSFFTGPIPEQQILPGVEYMIEKYGPRMYILAADYGFGQVSAQWTHAAAKRFGGEIVGEEFIPLGNSEFASSIANIQRARPDFLVLYLVGANQSQYFPQAQSAGITLPAISTVNLQQGFEHKRFAPPALQNMYVPVTWIEEVAEEVESGRAFVDAFRAKFPNTDYVNQPARCAYVAVHLMAQAWEKAGTTEADAVITALESGLSFDAPEGQVTLDGATHHLAMMIRMAQVQPDHSIKFVHNFGMIEPWWLRDIGVDLTQKAESRQYLPSDDPSLQ